MVPFAGRVNEVGRLVSALIADDAEKRHRSGYLRLAARATGLRTGRETVFTAFAARATFFRAGGDGRRTDLAATGFAARVRPVRDAAAAATVGRRVASRGIERLLPLSAPGAR